MATQTSTRASRSPALWQLSLQPGIFGGFPKLCVPFVRVIMISIIVCGDLYWAPPILRSYHFFVLVVFDFVAFGVLGSCDFLFPCRLMRAR